MGYIGHSPTNAGSFIEIDDFGSSFNGSTTAFNMQVGGVDVTPSASNVLCMIDGVVQMSGSAYTISGSTITFTEAPPSGADLYLLLMGQSASVGSGTIGADELNVSGDGTSGQVLTSDGDGSFSWATDTENYLPLAGGTMTGAINLGSQNITNGGTITGTFVGNITGNVTGNTSGTAATVTGAAQSNITSLGTLTTLTVDDITINGSTISDGGDLTLDIGGDIILDADGDNVKFKADGTAKADLSWSSGGDVTFFTETSNADLYIKGNDGGSTITAMMFDMSEGGRVGIGSTAPTTKLQIKADSTEEDVILLEDNSGTDIGAIKIHGGAFVMKGKSASAPIQLQTHDGNEDIEVDPDGFIKFETGGSERMRIISDGKVGIGTSSPENLLTIRQTENATESNITQDSDTWGVLVETGNYTADRFVGMIAHRNANKEAQTGIWSEITSSGSLMHLGTSADYDTGVNVKNMTLKHDGSVGIGCTPGDTVEIDGTNPILKIGNRIRIKADETNNTAWFGCGSDINTINLGDADFSSAYLSVKQATGRVGIGTTAPDQMLHVKTSSGDPSIVCETASGGGARLKLIGTDTNMSIQSSGGLNFYTGSSTTANGNLRMTLSSTGAIEFSGTAQETFQAKSSISSDAIFRFTKTTVNGGAANLKIQGYRNTSTSDTAILSFDNNTTTCARIYMRRVDDNSGTLILGGGDSGTIQDTLYLLNSGKVGIGTDSPTAHVSVIAAGTDGSGLARLTSSVSSGTPEGLLVYYPSVAPDNDGWGYYLQDSSAARFIVRNDGDVENHDNDYGATSDERIKDNITDAKSQWDDIKALRVRNFQRKDDIDQYGADKAMVQIGLIAQEVEPISSGLIEEKRPSDYEKDVLKIDGDVKVMKYSVLYMKAIKCLQEAMERIEALENA